MKTIKNLLSIEMVRQNTVFFIGMLIVSALNYAFHPLISRLVGVSDFGEVQFIVSSFLLLAIGANLFNLTIVNLYKHSNKSGKENVLTAALGVNIKISIMILTLGLLVSWPLGNLFNFSNPFLFFMIPLAWAVHLWANLYVAVFRAYSDFYKTSIVNIVISGSKLVLAGLLAYFGYEVFGVVAGMVLAGLIAALVGFLLHKERFKGTNRNIKLVKGPDDWRLVRFIALMSTSSILLLSLDTIIAKAKLNPIDAGLYSGIASVARIIFFLTVSFGVVLYSSLNSKVTKSEGMKKLRVSLLLFAVIATPALLLIWLFPTELLRLVLGDQYTVFAGSLPTLAISLYLVSASAMLINFLTAVRHYKATVSNGLAIAVGLILLVSVGSNVDSLVRAMYISSSTLFIVNIYEVWRWRQQSSG